MILISHRGNLDGRNLDMENNPIYVDRAINSGFDVEIDIWVSDNKLYLGHDCPQYIVDLDWLNLRKNKLWIHCKNVDSILFMKDSHSDFNYFWHENDTLALTSKKDIWAFPGKQPILGSISVIPEIYNDDISTCKGVCSDYIQHYIK